MPKDLSPEYRWSTSMKNPDWRAKRRQVFCLTLGRDVLIPFLPAQQADHLRYWDKHGNSLLGREMPLRDLVPLHAGTHWVVTRLREMGLKHPVNFVLRAAFMMWFFVYAYIILMVGQLIGIWHGVPLPSFENFHKIQVSFSHVIAFCQGIFHRSNVGQNG